MVMVVMSCCCCAVGEATVTGMLMVSGQLVGIGLIFLFNWMIDNHYYHESGWVATGLTG